MKTGNDLEEQVEAVIEESSDKIPNFFQFWKDMFIAKKNEREYMMNELSERAEKYFHKSTILYCKCVRLEKRVRKLEKQLGIKPCKHENMQNEFICSDCGLYIGEDE